MSAKLAGAADRLSNGHVSRLALGLIKYLQTEVPDITRNEALAVLGLTMTTLVETVDSKTGRERLRQRIKHAVDMTGEVTGRMQ